MTKNEKHKHTREIRSQLFLLLSGEILLMEDKYMIAKAMK